MNQKRLIPYGRQDISEDDIEAVVQVLRSDWLTQGPAVENFEKAIASYCGARYAVAVSNGTAALHLAALAAGFGPEDEVITSPITFVASANCIAYTGAKPVFADIDPRTYCVNPAQVRNKLTSATRGIIPVHFAGQPCDMEAIYSIGREKDLVIIEDAAHAIGACYEVDGHVYKVGSCAHSDMTIFSFHPVKHMTTGEGGAITTNSPELYEKLLLLRTHGITKDSAKLQRDEGAWYYEQQTLGYNYRITDMQCALGLSQLKRLDIFVERRREIAQTYSKAFRIHSSLIIPFERPGSHSSWHLYMLGFKGFDRREVFDQLRAKGLGVNVHYIPVTWQPFYQVNYGTALGDCPVADKYYAGIVTLPLFASMTKDDVDYVIHAVLDIVKEPV
ncbi:UDP-4-amino-4,6-dideoxy-N-acetyl-beta-L-altrosamine transaminase [Desulfuromonas sp. KJ2020]|uniref:UDP-4-amino-4, 6-dideoxy-N-acetyl-beta-L-altrosamine transaminase n=1 Tax=Desulfuromonas sp. KJ2020 TaxID=2919173 RepID=UPI0020A80E4F|nr:UDP-4-amino-4,6-dideoxy-N-acetyl-beta-L-altrosamine transaminase [Desulfuromonas sp. KJ2020]MCP3177553.1 UDP-4-amino-4,6-dideoxy-N-acetyl-beta-L-altrosamine transaminase [Desulfuromonas sp. KJ2020]